MTVFSKEIWTEGVDDARLDLLVTTWTCVNHLELSKTHGDA